MGLEGIAVSGAALGTIGGCFLALSLLLAFAFEFVNGFHDTANAVAAVIYTNSLKPKAAVIWSALCNYFGAAISSGAVAYGIVALLPSDLSLNSEPATAFALVFSLLSAALIWNVGTWRMGLPASSSHALIGAILGVSLGHAFFAPAGQAEAGVDWSKALDVGLALILSPVIGFVGSALLQKLLGRWLVDPVLRPPVPGDRPPVWPVRLLLILTCTGVSFAHGSNDGQKGMGILMLILIAFLPGLYALNPDTKSADYAALADTGRALNPVFAGSTRLASSNERLLGELAQAAQSAGLSPGLRRDIRRDSLDVDREIGRALNQPGSPRIEQQLLAYRARLRAMTEYLPNWVKLATAFAIGLGTMVGWRRIVVTVGEKIGQRQLTAGQGVCAGIVTAGTIVASDFLGLPVSTTHVLSSGVAGTMVATGAGLRFHTLRNILMAWILTLPATVFLGSLFFAVSFYAFSVHAG